MVGCDKIDVESPDDYRDVKEMICEVGDRIYLPLCQHERAHAQLPGYFNVSNFIVMIAYLMVSKNSFSPQVIYFIPHFSLC